MRKYLKRGIEIRNKNILYDTTSSKLSRVRIYNLKDRDVSKIFLININEIVSQRQEYVVCKFNKFFVSKNFNDKIEIE